ncbi:MAG: carbohydrate-binding module family 14 protein [Rikenellaceae bacterium]|nr:carbohydrate-binding module family 14 protein [Rikenellaceae bacterium]MCL2693214.1 carbohydrate-binding module family 14 protein [Rikenellaceae bacterium]
MRNLIRKLTPKTTLNKINLALTGLFFVLLAGNIYMRSKTEGIFFAHPDDRTKYFELVNGALFLHQCPPGLYFCPALQICYWEDEDMCNYGSGGSGSGGQKGEKKERIVETYTSTAPGWAYEINGKAWFVNGKVATSWPPNYQKVTDKYNCCEFRDDAFTICEHIPC